MKLRYNGETRIVEVSSNCSACMKNKSTTKQLSHLRTGEYFLMSGQTLNVVKGMVYEVGEVDGRELLNLVTNINGQTYPRFSKIGD